jgi:hypothetical protein
MIEHRQEYYRQPSMFDESDNMPQDPFNQDRDDIHGA